MRVFNLLQFMFMSQFMLQIMFYVTIYVYCLFKIQCSDEQNSTTIKRKNRDISKQIFINIFIYYD